MMCRARFAILFVACVALSANSELTESCSDNNGGCDPVTNCFDTEVGVECGQCPYLNYVGNGVDGCIDVDECLDSTNCDPKTECFNLEGGYTCTPCPPGYEGSGREGCLNINECARGIADCHPFASCSDTDGSYTCKCGAGYLGDGRGAEGCLDINECKQEEWPCKSAFEVCTNVPGSFYCLDAKCKLGYKLAADGKTCLDINECEVNNGGCALHTTCTDLEGGYECSACPEGFQGDAVTGCVNINECLVNNGGCHPTNDCQDVPGTHHCVPCPPGYEGTGGNGCVDVDECDRTVANCNELVQCTNTPGSYFCGTCPDGYKGTGIGPKGCSSCPAGYIQGDADSSCNDIDECKDGLSNCHPMVQCKNTIGSFECGACPAGYKGDGIGANGCEELVCDVGYALTNVSNIENPCTDIDECASSSLNDCHALSECLNTPGTFECGGCPVGYEGTGYGTQDGCKDVDECVNADTCPLGDCVNTPGSFQCGDYTCQEGFVKREDLKGCNDIDECLIKNGGCDRLTQCTNFDGGFTCSECPAGYVGTGLTGCQDVNECMVNNGGCNPKPCINLNGGFECGECPDGFEPKYGVCLNINECQTDQHDCTRVPKVTCVDTKGSYTCGQCPQGFQGSGLGEFGCDDINECVDGAICGADLFCTNTPASYECANFTGTRPNCPAGYTKNAGGGCSDVDECLVANGGCGADVKCFNRVGSFECGACAVGYSMRNGECQDVNECVGTPPPCDGGRERICLVTTHTPGRQMTDGRASSGSYTSITPVDGADTEAQADEGSCCSTCWCWIKILPFVITILLVLPFSLIGFVVAAIFSPLRCCGDESGPRKFQQWWWSLACAVCWVWSCFWGIKPKGDEGEEQALQPRA